GGGGRWGGGGGGGLGRGEALGAGREVDRIRDAEIEAEAAERVVHVRTVAGEKDAALAERGGDALVHVVEVAVHDRVGAVLGKELLQPALHRRFVLRLLVGLGEARGKQHAPEAFAVIAGDLEQRAPFVGVGEVV